MNKIKLELLLTIMFSIFIHTQIGEINIFSLITSLIVGGAFFTLIIGTIRLLKELFNGK